MHNLSADSVEGVKAKPNPPCGSAANSCHLKRDEREPKPESPRRASRWLRTLNSLVQTILANST